MNAEMGGIWLRFSVSCVAKEIKIGYGSIAKVSTDAKVSCQLIISGSDNPSHEMSCETLSQVILHAAAGKSGAMQAARYVLLGCGLVNKLWRKASEDDTLWQALAVRTAPSSPWVPPGAVEVLTFATEPAVASRLACKTAGINDHRAYFRQRCIAATAAADAFRRLDGRALNEGQARGAIFDQMDWQMPCMPRMLTTRMAALGEALPALRLDEITYMFELYEMARLTARRQWPRVHKAPHRPHSAPGTAWESCAPGVRRRLITCSPRACTAGSGTTATSCAAAPSRNAFRRSCPRRRTT